MEKLTLEKKTGFKVIDPFEPVNIRDVRGVLFYSTEDLLPKVEYFNLPAGEFFVDSGHIVKADKPREYKLADLPTPERDNGSMSDFDVKFETNPHKCTVYWDTKEIVFDKAFEERPIPQVMFILFHEFGHRYYETEKLADLYASNMMKVKGYNPSQIADAQMYSLSDKQYDRKEFVIENLINTL